MTDAQIQTLVSEYNWLTTLLEQEQSKAHADLATVRSLEDNMATIETQFQRADLDIMQWI